MTTNDGDRHDLARIGLFSELGYLKLTPVSPVKRDQDKGKQFTTSPPKQDCYFTKNYARAFAGEGYTDMVLVRRKQRKESTKRNLQPNSFRPANVPPSSCGKGSIYGTFTQAYPVTYRKEALVVQPSENISIREKSPEPRSIYTSPMKKGGYGYNQGTIGQMYEYMSSPFEAERQLNNESRERSKTLWVGQRPFVSASTNRDCFDLNIFAGSEPYTMAEPEPSETHPIAWRPSSSPQSYLNTFPLYQPPFPHPSKQEIAIAIHDKVAMAKEKRSTAPDKISFKPVGAGNRAYPIKSISGMHAIKTVCSQHSSNPRDYESMVPRKAIHSGKRQAPPVVTSRHPPLPLSYLTKRNCNIESPLQSSQ